MQHLRKILKRCSVRMFKSRGILFRVASELNGESSQKIQAKKEEFKSKQARTIAKDVCEYCAQCGLELVENHCKLVSPL